MAAGRVRVELEHGGPSALERWRGGVNVCRTWYTKRILSNFDGLAQVGGVTDKLRANSALGGMGLATGIQK
jgi:hypothetical protein